MKAGRPSRSDSSLSDTVVSPSSAATASRRRTGVSRQPGIRTWKAAASALGSWTASGRTAGLTRNRGTLGDTTAMDEAEIVTTDHGDVPRGEGWYVLNARRAQWQHSPGGTEHVLVGAGDGPCVVVAYADSPPFTDGPAPAGL